MVGSQTGKERVTRETTDSMSTGPTRRHIRFWGTLMSLQFTDNLNGIFSVLETQFYYICMSVWEIGRFLSADACVCV